ncbi:MAG TPA: chromate transporter [Clostridiales bacterium]|nr:chromate transporter [Clostridiales bacterium]
MPNYLNLFLTFARIGAFTFGGGYAMLPILQREVVDKNSWCTEDELTDMYAIGQCTPGVIAVNVATYIGNKCRGPLGAVCSTLGVITPSVCIIIVIAALLSNFAEYAAVQHAFSGIRIVVCALVTKTIWTMVRKNVRDAATAVFFLLSFCSVALLGISPVAAVLVCGLAGALLRGGKTEGGK